MPFPKHDPEGGIAKIVGFAAIALLAVFLLLLVLR